MKISESLDVVEDEPCQRDHHQYDERNGHKHYGCPEYNNKKYKLEILSVNQLMMRQIKNESNQ